MEPKYIVVQGYYGKNGRGEFIQAVGAYSGLNEACGAALLALAESADPEKGESITPPFPLEGDTGHGMEVKHENFTDYAYVLFVPIGYAYVLSTKKETEQQEKHEQ